MAKKFPWKRFWCRREASFSLGDSGFLSDPDGKYGATLNPHLTTLDRLQDLACLALLGEPGVGKSWSLTVDVDAFLKKTDDLEVIRLDLRSFGSEDRLYRALFEHPTFLRWASRESVLQVYLDSFDECLLRIETVAGLLADELPNYPLHRLKLRIACRTASWPPVLERALKAGFGEDSFAAAELVPLRRVDVLQAAALTGIAVPDAFLERVDQLGLAPLASKPITLKLLLEAFQSEGDLPPDLLSLYEKGCLILCEEQNESRRAARRTGTLSAAGRLAVATRVAAVTQFGNRFAIWTGTEASAIPLEDVSIAQLVGGTETADESMNISSQVILEALDTGLFSSRGEERLGWSHQTFAEYLAARYCLRHGLSIQQLKSLVFHPRRARIIPQLREVASWLALQDSQLFLDISENDPEVLLGSAAPSLSPEQCRVLTDALLRSCDESEVLHVHHNLAVRHLAHATLGEQLEFVLRDPKRSNATRFFAAQVARRCSVEGLGDALLKIALCDEETHDMRSVAAYAVADLGSTAERERMRPLLTASREIDPDDQLRGAALSAIYPADKYDDAMWDFLDSPRKSLFFGAYDTFLSQFVMPKLNPQNLTDALRWCQRQPIEEVGPIPDLEANIFALAVSEIKAPGIAQEFARAALRRCKSYRGFPERRHSKEKSIEAMLREDESRRRSFLTAFLPLLNTLNIHVLYYPLSVLTGEDLVWFIERIQSGISPNPVAEAQIVCRLACSWQTDLMTAVWYACESNAVLAAECRGIFAAAPIDSDEAKWARGTGKNLLVKSDQKKASELLPRVEAALLKSEAGDPDEWIRLTSEMSVDEGGTHYKQLRSIRLLELPGWLGASQETRSRIVEAGKRYLLQTSFPELDSAPSNQIRNGASGGINALSLLQSVEPMFLQQQPVEFWRRWIPSFTEDGRAGEEKESVIEEVFRLAGRCAPDAMNQRLLELIDFENASDQKYLFCSAMLDRQWSDSLGLVLFQRLQTCDLSPSIQGSLLIKLLLRDVAGVRTWAENVIRGENGTQRAMIFARCLLSAGEGKAWPVLWPLIQADANFGRSLVEGFSYGYHGGTSFGESFTEVELEEIYVWFAEQYPMENDRIASGTVGPFDTVRFFRDGVLEVLKRRGTFEACDAIARVELRLPQYKWLRYHFDEAEVLACALTWEPPSPEVILAMGEDESKRFVGSNEQLLNVIVESLNRLQAELHGELAAVGDLWNSHEKEWWPKQEEDISDYIARYLRRELSERGVVVNREVQIRRGRRGEMPGQDTDIHVDALSSKRATESHCGPVRAIIEVKGTWNDGLMTDMEVQLRDRYLRNSGCRTGLYVAAHFAAKNWRVSDSRRAKSDRWEINYLRTRLGEQAKALSGSVTIRSFVIDASLDSTIATGIEGYNMPKK